MGILNFSKHLPRVILRNPSKASKLGIMIPNLQMEKLRPRVSGTE